MRVPFSEPRPTRGASLTTATHHVLARRVESQALPEEPFASQDQRLAVARLETDRCRGLRSHGGPDDTPVPSRVA